MKQEIQIAANFLASFVPPGKERSLVENSLLAALHSKLKDHWYEETPERGQGYRSINVTADGRPDRLLQLVQKQVETPVPHFLQSLPYDLCLWIDPSSVSYRQGSNYVVCLYDASAAAAAKTSFKPAASSSPVILKNPNSPQIKLSMSPPRADRFPREFINVA